MEGLIGRLEGKSRVDVGRQELLWTEDRIVSQLLGWELRLAFKRGSRC